MKHIFLIFALMVFSGGVAYAQTPGKGSDYRTATAFRLEIPDDSYSGLGFLYLTVGDSEIKIADSAYDAWIINDGKEVVYSGNDGAGGYENEGQSLYLYDLATGKIRTVLSQYYKVDALMEVKTSDGKTALLIRMSDGGLGASYFSVVDPKRREVFFRRFAEMTGINGDNITIAIYRNYDWEGDAFREGDNYIGSRKDSGSNQVILLPPNVKPDKTETHDLKKILKKKVIYNKPDRP